MPGHAGMTNYDTVSREEGLGGKDTAPKKLMSLPAPKSTQSSGRRIFSLSITGHVPTLNEKTLPFEICNGLFHLTHVDISSPKTPSPLRGRGSGGGGLKQRSTRFRGLFTPTLPSPIEGEGESTLKNLKDQAENRSLYQPTASAGFLKSGSNEHESSGKAHFGFYCGPRGGAGNDFSRTPGLCSGKSNGSSIARSLASAISAGPRRNWVLFYDPIVLD